MSLPDRRILLGMAIGAVSAMAVAAIGPGQVIQAFADEMPAGFDTSRLVKFDGKNFTVDYEDWVSTDPIATQVVKKIEGGRVSYVTITTTATGTYSSDAMTSRHIEYPGIEVNAVPERPNRISIWQYSGNSFVSMRQNDVTITSGFGRTCVRSKSFSYC